MNAFPQNSTGGFKVDIGRGSRVGRVSSEWFSRPADQRFLNLDDLHAYTHGRAERSTTRIVDTQAIEVVASRDNSDMLKLQYPGCQGQIVPTHWAFGQLASLVGAPAGYLRQLPAPIAAINLQYGFKSDQRELIKVQEYDDGQIEMRAATGPTYGRIHDKDLVAAVQTFAGDGVTSTRFKVPGLLDWSTMRHNPFVDVSKETTTLYASDRDVFVFLCDDTNPIEAGRLPNGEPDLFFRGFYCWNSEVGARTLGLASFYLRAVCANRNLWGVEDFQEITIRHSKFAAHRFAKEAEPALIAFANSSPSSFVRGIQSARETIVARSDDDRRDFLQSRKFPRNLTTEILDTVFVEEGRPASSVFDFVQGITAVARRRDKQDERLDLEMAAKKIMDKVA